MRTSVLMFAVAMGFLVATSLGLVDVEHTVVYQAVVTTLLGIGLYASTQAIRLDEFRTELRTVLIAVTAGVFCKAVIIAGVMYLVFHNPAYIVLGVAVAQIDPLSVAAVIAKTKMSPSAKTLLLAWASFDDPITVLLTGYFVLFALDDASSEIIAVGGGFGSVLVNILLNLLLAAVMWILWRTFNKLRGRPRLSTTSGRVVQVMANVTLAIGVTVMAAMAVSQSLLFGLALTGLFFRPAAAALRFVDLASSLALCMAALALGLVLVHGVMLVEGVILGAAAYVSQIIVAMVVTLPRRWHGNRARLALSQQNGLTAIVLALILSPVLPEAVAIIAPAILVIHLLHAMCNRIWDRVSTSWSSVAALPGPEHRAPHPRAQVLQRTVDTPVA